MHLQPRKQITSWTASKVGPSRFKGRGSAHLLFFHGTPPGVQHPALGSPAQKVHAPVGNIACSNFALV